MTIIEPAGRGQLRVVCSLCDFRFSTRFGPLALRVSEIHEAFAHSVVTA